MIEFLENTMWLNISNKLHKNVDESKIIIIDLFKRYQDDRHFRLIECDKNLQDAFIYYVNSKKQLNLD